MDPKTAQRRAAARRGTEVRSRRADVKRSIASGLLSLEKIIAGRLVSAETMTIAREIRIGQLLRSAPGIGELTAATILSELDIPSDRALKDLTRIERGQIVRLMKRRTAA